MIPGDQGERSASVLKKDTEWAAAVIWRSEFRNVLTLYMRHQGISHFTYNLCLSVITIVQVAMK